MNGSTDGGPLGSVRRFIEGFNRNDIELAQSACAGENSIIDDFPPHEWRGRGATTAWLTDMNRMGAEYGMSEASVELDEANAQVTISDTRAYVTAVVDVRWLQDGAPARRGGRLTLALRGDADAWRITALAWAWD